MQTEKQTLKTCSRSTSANNAISTLPTQQQLLPDEYQNLEVPTIEYSPLQEGE